MTDNGHDAFWRGSFGDDYTDRNLGSPHANIAFFARALRHAPGIESIYEIGTNRGLNLDALSVMQPNATRAGIELNEKAAAIARTRHPSVEIGSIHDKDFHDGEQYDLVVTKGVLIHIEPEKLDGVLEKIAQLSRRYVLIAEYYNPTPVELQYRGHKERLYKRDFASEFLKRGGFTAVDYGFVWRHDPTYPADDITWFLLKRIG